MELVEQLLPVPDKQFQQEIFNQFDPIAYQHNFDVLKQWFEHETGITCNSTYENQIHITLRGAKNDLHRARKRFQNYFLYKTKFPQFYEFYDLSSNLQQFKTLYCLCQPGITSEGYRISCIGLSSPNIEDFDIDTTFKTLFMIGNIGMCLTHPHFLGIIVIIDLKHASTKHALKLLSWTFRRFQKFNNEVLSLRLSKLFIINVPSYIEKFVLIGRAFLSEKLRSRFHIEQSDKEMRKHVPINLLPCDYGGEGESISSQTERWFRLIQEVRPWIEAAHGVQLTGSSKTTSRSARTASTASATGATDVTDLNDTCNESKNVKRTRPKCGNGNEHEDVKEILFEFPDGNQFGNAENVNIFENVNEENESLLRNEFDLDFSRLEID